MKYNIDLMKYNIMKYNINFAKNIFMFSNKTKNIKFIILISYFIDSIV